MRLTKTIITGFRSINGPETLLVDKAVTVLIGANDHGKSNLLRAIQTLNDDAPIKAEDIAWDHSAEKKPEIAWHFTLDRGELSQLISMGAFPGKEQLAEPEFAAFKEGLLKEPNANTVVYRRVGVESPVTVEWPTQELAQPHKDYLLKRRPRIELFTPQDKVFDEVNRKQLDDPAYEFMKGIFIKAGLWEKRDSIFRQDSRTGRQLAEASKRLTARLKADWEQGKDLEWMLQHSKDGSVIRLEIHDPSVESTWVRPSQRSNGFTAFFVLSLTTFARTESREAEAHIYLFDEPGTYLHPIAQINLQRVFEKLAEKHQVVYTTHSLFLVNKNHPIRNRVVRKSTSGTQVDKKPFAGNWKAVRESLGIRFSQNFLIADTTLLVEGPSDVIYIHAGLSHLVRHDLVDIDMNQLSISDAGDHANYVAMAKIMLDEDRKVVALIDGDEAGARLSQRLEKICQKYIASKSLTVHRLPSKFSIEDVVPYGKLLHEATWEALHELIESGEHQIPAGSDLAKIQADLSQGLSQKDATCTFGLQIVKTIQAILNTRETISKVNIACRYEDKLSALRGEKNQEIAHILELADALKGKMGLQPRKSEKTAFSTKS